MGWLPSGGLPYEREGTLVGNFSYTPKGDLSGHFWPLLKALLHDLKEAIFPYLDCLRQYDETV